MSDYIRTINGEVPLDDEHTRLLLYVVTYHETFGRGPTYDEMVAVTGRSRSTIRLRLLVLYDRGLVDWKPHSDGTLHPLVRVVG